MRNEKGQFVKGYGFWEGKKRPNLSGDLHPNKKLENRLKISQAKIGKKRPDMVGEKNWAYTGNDLRKVKQEVKLRDNFTCQMCGLYDPEIVEVDHIKPQSRFPELTMDKNNMQTLCPNCHVRKTKRERDKRRKLS